MQAIRPMQITETKSITVIGEAQDIDVNGRMFTIANTGGQPLYINPKELGSATSNNAAIPANTQYPVILTCSTKLSVISNATGTTVSIVFLDI